MRTVMCGAAFLAALVMLPAASAGIGVFYMQDGADPTSDGTLVTDQPTDDQATVRILFPGIPATFSGGDAGVITGQAWAGIWPGAVTGEPTIQFTVSAADGREIATKTATLTASPLPDPMAASSDAETFAQALPAHAAAIFTQAPLLVQLGPIDSETVDGITVKIEAIAGSDPTATASIRYAAADAPTFIMVSYREPVVPSNPPSGGDDDAPDDEGGVDDDTGSGGGAIDDEADPTTGNPDTGAEADEDSPGFGVVVLLVAVVVAGVMGRHKR